MRTVFLTPAAESNPKAVEDVFALLRTVADPEVAQARLAEIQQAMADATAQAEAASATLYEVSAIRADLEKREVEVNARLSAAIEREGTNKANAQRLAADQETLNQERIRIEEGHAARGRELAATADRLATRMADFDARETALAEAEAAAAALKAEYDRKVAALEAAMR